MRLYEAMPEAVVDKMKRADLEDSNRTQTQPKKMARNVKPPPNDRDKVIDTPMGPIHDAPEATGNDSEAPASADDMLDTTNFFGEVNRDTGDDLEVEYEGNDLIEEHGDHTMSPMTAQMTAHKSSIILPRHLPLHAIQGP